ncbi:MAG: UDP-N-acetylmuramoyl-L-alanyl-D-glutamate--2,6-diaminopimelate ligase [Clostridia bacterium]|nr:UDP-N-acetylmuramoyl-L-alanyl-D-glutamate--2,6-diaminopimelate ligase [Clostridia bacterium]
MKLSAMLKDADYLKTVGDTNREVQNICYDSRKVKPNDMFVCIVGYETDGHKYIESAISAGASVIVVQEGAEIPEFLEKITVIFAENTRKILAQLSAAFYGHPEKQLKIIGVTGTNGKTTVTTLVKSILEFEGKTVGLIGTNANMICGRILPTERTTPESLELFALFAEMVAEDVEYVVMEVSSHSLDLFRVWGIEFCVGAFTNLTQDHLDFHGTMEQYLNAKKKLFLQSRCGVVNVDDNAGKSVLETAGCPTLSYAIDHEADMKASDIHLSARGVIFSVFYNGQQYTVRLGIPGKFSVYNALTAIGVVVAAGIEISRAIEALTFAKGVMGRCETVYTNTDYTVIIDYAHSPDGLENIIKTVREFSEGRVITLFGCGGDRDRTKRPIMGEIAGRLSDFCIVTSDNPRTEEPNAIIDDILVGVAKTDCDHVVIENRRDAIGYALKFARQGDCVILAGKGHETYQILGKTKHHFDEREVVAEYLAEMKKAEVQE